MVHIAAKAKTDIGNGLIVDKIPAGLEIENLNIVRGESLAGVTIAGMNPGEVMNNSRIKHVEFRDDRFVAAVRMQATPAWDRVGATNTNLFYRARVVTPGQFTMPPVYAEDMYRPNIYGIGGVTETLTIAEGR